MNKWVKKNPYMRFDELKTIFPFLSSPCNLLYRCGDYDKRATIVVSYDDNCSYERNSNHHKKR